MVDLFASLVSLHWVMRSFVFRPRDPMNEVNWVLTAGVTFLSAL